MSGRTNEIYTTPVEDELTEEITSSDIDDIKAHFNDIFATILADDPHTTVQTEVAA